MYLKDLTDQALVCILKKEGNKKKGKQEGKRSPKPNGSGRVIYQMMLLTKHSVSVQIFCTLLSARPQRTWYLILKGWASF